MDDRINLQKLGNIKNYLPRLVDKILEDRIDAKGVFLIEGPEC